MAKQLTPAQVNAAYAAAQAKDKSAQQTQAWNNNIGVYNNSIKTPATGMTQNTIGGGNNQNGTAGMITSSQLALQNNPGAAKEASDKAARDKAAKDAADKAARDAADKAARDAAAKAARDAAAKAAKDAADKAARDAAAKMPILRPMPTPPMMYMPGPGGFNLPGGPISAPKPPAQTAAQIAAAQQAAARQQQINDSYAISENARKHAMGVPGYAKGGSASSRGDGIAKRGKTVGKVVGGVARFARGGAVKSSAPKVSNASRRGDGIALRGKTRGMIR